MPQFTYEARDKLGRTVAGRIDAADRLQASVKLRESELWILRLDPAGAAIAPARMESERVPAARGDSFYAFFPVRAAPLRDFFSQLAELLEAGVSVYESMTVLPERVVRRLRPVLAAISPALAEGQPLSDQLARYPHLFSRVDVGMIRAGERSGNLGAMCRLLADQYQQDHSIWLMLLLPRMYGALVILFAILVPSLPGIIAHGTVSKANWDWWVQHFVHVLLPLMVGVILLDQVFRWILRQPWAAGFRADLLYYLPGAAGYFRPAMYSRVLTVLEEMVRAGASFPEALRMAAEAAGPGALGRQLNAAAAKVQGGMPLGPAVNAVTKLPFNARAALLTAEQSGRQEQTLGRLARTQIEAMEAAPRRVAVLGYVGGLVIFSVIAGIAIVFAYKNYFEAIFSLGEKMMP